MSRAPVRRETLAEQAATALREEINSGELAAGEKINIDDAAERLGMSRDPGAGGPAGALAAVGLVGFEPQRGYTVDAASLEDCLDTYRLRLLLDPLATELSVPNLGAEDLARAEAALEDLVVALQTGNQVQLRRPHREFHFAIYGKCDSEWLLRILEMLWENSERYQKISAEPRGTPDERAREHQAILAAAVAGDGPSAAQAVLEHLSRTQAAVAGVFAETIP